MRLRAHLRRPLRRPRLRASQQAESTFETRRAPVLGRGLSMVRPFDRSPAGGRSRRMSMRLLERARPKDLRELSPPPKDDDAPPRLVRRADTDLRRGQLRRLARRELRGRSALAAHAPALPRSVRRAEILRGGTART